ncbi:MAG: alpha-L-rhamnosidase C-terminal domain-containing protein [Ignavibacteriaceae bacterium]
MLTKRTPVKGGLALLRFTIILLFSINLYGQESTEINPFLLNNKWTAQWITFPEGSLKDYGVFHFRKTINLQNGPQKFIIHASGDNRYRFFVNGKEVCNGPARGDPGHWRFETIDIAKYLHSGQNVLAAVVWNFGEFIPLAQMTNKTAFILQGDTKQEYVVNTGDSWKVYKDEAYIPPVTRSFRTVVGPGDLVDGSKYPWGWELPDFDDSTWKLPKLLGNGIPYGKFEGWDWMLVPRNIPFMKHEFQRINKLVRSENIAVDDDFLTGKLPLHIPANSNVKILIDNTYLTTAYPELIISGGKSSMVEIRYAEALINDKGEKGNRNDIKGKRMDCDYPDVFKPDGGNNRHFQPLWFRAFRYIELAIQTKDNPLTINDLYSYSTGYPFKQLAYFNSDDSSLMQIWNAGWRTARLCAGETYFDCPYYEQLQYIGDTRIEALISLYVTGDDRLMKNAIEQFYDSQLAIGLTQSRYPSSQPQVIPPFSLYWIDMVHDFWMFKTDSGFVKKYLNGIKNVLDWYKQQIAANGMLGPMDWWNFVDWSFGPWSSEKPIGGSPAGVLDGNSSIITLQYVYTLQMAAEIFQAFGDEDQAQQYNQLSKYLIKSTYALCWNPDRGLIADTPQKSGYSQHANVMAIIVGMFDKDTADSVMQRIFNQTDLTQCTYYYRFYLNRALEKTGMADQYLLTLGPWKKMLEMGLTTFAEQPEPTRSDCHGWSASPVYEFLENVCGIKPASPGFQTVKIEPHLGNLKYIDAKMPYPEGNIEVKLKRKGNDGIEGDIFLPDGVPGKFIWQGKEFLLKPGNQKVEF